MKGATLRVSVSNPSADLPAVLPLIERGLFDPGKVRPMVADWDNTRRALLKHATKVVIRRAPLGLADASRGVP